MPQVFQAILFHSDQSRQLKDGVHCPESVKWVQLIAHVFSGEESKTRRTYIVPKAEERRVDRPSQESKKPPDTKLAESFREEKGAAKRQWPSSEWGGRTLRNQTCI